MFRRMLKNDFQRNKVIMATLFFFIILSSLLVSSAASIILELSRSLENLLVESNAPHFVQMHIGEINQPDIDNFVSENSLVKEEQTVEMIGIDSSSLFFGKGGTTDQGSVMDNSFVKQNKAFDWLLNLNGEVIHVSKGEIAVPIYYMQQKNLEIGDEVSVSKGSFHKSFIVKEFVRDVQMNPSIVSSKRFLVNEADLELLKENFGTIEYLIEFQLTDITKLSLFRNAYQAASLPQKGPTIDYNLFKMLNALTDGIVAAVIILVSFLLVGIAILCLRFTMLGAIEEDYREIGVMKAIGIDGRDIKKLYLSKYIAMAMLASGSGYFLSLLMNRFFTANMTLYMGVAKKSFINFWVPLLASTLIFLFVVFCCWLILRRFQKISAVEAIRSGNAAGSKTRKGLLSLNKSKFPSVNLYLGINDVLSRFKAFSLLCAIFIVCSFMIIVPINFLNTLQSPNFVTYMGIGRSDLRLDLRQSEDVSQKFNELVNFIEKDQDIKKFSPLITCTFKVLSSEGVYENIQVETGDFTIFPLEYLNGKAPTLINEMAISYMNAKDMDKEVGDSLQLLAGGQEYQMVISGIYQDITNGGKTAKAMISYDVDNVLWYVVNLDVKPGVGIDEKVQEYTKRFDDVKVTDLEAYLFQTLGATIKQLKLVTTLSFIIAIAIAVLITTLFLKMQLAKDSGSIAIMKSIGFTLRDIRKQYVTRSLLVLGFGILLGTLVANTLGQSLVSRLGSFMGASRIQFAIDPIEAYIFCPMILMAIVSLTTWISLVPMKKTSIREMIVE